MSERQHTDIGTAEFGNFYFRNPADSAMQLLEKVEADTVYPNPFVRLDFAITAHAKATTDLTGAEAALQAGRLSLEAGLEAGLQQDWNSVALSAIRRCLNESSAAGPQPGLPQARTPRKGPYVGRRKFLSIPPL